MPADDAFGAVSILQHQHRGCRQRHAIQHCQRERKHCGLGCYGPFAHHAPGAHARQRPIRIHRPHRLPAPLLCLQRHILPQCDTRRCRREPEPACHGQCGHGDCHPFQISRTSQRISQVPSRKRRPVRPCGHYPAGIQRIFQRLAGSHRHPRLYEDDLRPQQQAIPQILIVGGPALLRLSGQGQRHRDFRAKLSRALRRQHHFRDQFLRQ